MRALAAASLVLASLAAAATAGAQATTTTLSDVLGRNADDGVHVDAYVGVDYTTFSRQGQQFGVRGLSLEPYVLKTADVKVSNLSRFDFGLNAAVTSLLAAGGFAQPSDSAANTDTTNAERYAAMIAYAINPKLKVRTEAYFARLVTYVAPDFQPHSNFPITTYYAPQSGGLQRLEPGGGVNGATSWSSAAVILDWDDGTSDGIKQVGYRIFQLQTLSPYQVNYNNGFPAFQAVVQDSTLCNAASFEGRSSRKLYKDVDLGGTIHGFAGYALISSAFVNQAQGGCFGLGGNLSLLYQSPHWRLEVGYMLDQMVAFAFGGSNLSQLVLFNNTSTGRAVYAASGSSWSVSGQNLQSISVLGPFLHLTAHF